MKKIYYIFLIVFSGIIFTSCEENTDDVYQINQDEVLAVFDSYKVGLGGLADGSEYAFQIKVKITGPGIEKLTDDVEITVGADATSTAIEGTHYRMENKTITLTKQNGYLGLLDFVLVTEGNTPPLDDAPEFLTYKVPVINLKIITTSTTSVKPSGKFAVLSLNYTPPNPYAGDYDVELRYYHPTAGGSHPSFPDFDPDDPYGGIRSMEKTLTALTGRKCETGFAVWPETDLCWITVNADNSVTFKVDEKEDENDETGWGYAVKMGDPFNPELVSHYDPDTRVIYVYYHYVGTGGARIFYEVFTPKFK